MHLFSMSIFNNLFWFFFFFCSLTLLELDHFLISLINRQVTFSGFTERNIFMKEFKMYAFFFSLIVSRYMSALDI
jgi:hypothetical protein